MLRLQDTYMEITMPQYFFLRTSNYLIEQITFTSEITLLDNVLTREGQNFKKGETQK